MATAADLINAALKRLRVVDSDSTADSTQLADALLDLNEFIDELNADTTTLFQEDEEVFTLTGAASYTIGSSGTFNTTRPQEIISAFYRLDDTDHPPLRRVSKVDWDEIPDKAAEGYPEVLWYEESYPLGVLYLWPNPAEGSLVLTTLKQLTSFASSSTSVSLPPGYQSMLSNNLAVRYSPRGGILTAEIIKAASSALAKIKRKNRKTAETNLECPGVSSSGGRTILTG